MSDANPDRLLPETLREHWAVLPRRSLPRSFMVFLALGAGIGLSIAGVIENVPWMEVGLPVAVIATRVLGIFLPSDDLLLRELGRTHPEVIDDSELLAPGTSLRRRHAVVMRSASTAVVTSLAALGLSVFASAHDAAVIGFASAAVVFSAEALVGSRRHNVRKVSARALGAIAASTVAVVLCLAR